MRYFPIILTFVLTGCQSKTDNCNLSYVGMSGNVYHIKGCLINSLEDGKWLVYDTQNHLVESGCYRDGLRVGKWDYFSNNSDIQIVWKRYISDLGFETSIPDFLSLVSAGEDFVKFKDTVHSGTLNLLIAVHNIRAENIDPRTFYKVGQSELQQMGWSFKNKQSTLCSRRDTYYIYELVRNSTGK